MPQSVMPGVQEPDHFEALFRHATMGILITNSSGIMTAVNPYALYEFGYTEEELIGRKIEILIPSRFHKSHASRHKGYFENPKTRQMGSGKELYGIKKDGTEFAVEISLSHYRQQKEDFVIAFINNISARKKSETDIIVLNNQLEQKVEKRTADLEQTLHKLENTNSKLQDAVAFQNALLQNAGVMIISTDPEGVIQTFNPGAENELGYKASEVIGKYTPELFHCPEQTKERALQFSGDLGETITPGFQTYIANARLNAVYEDEWTYIHKNGKKFPVSLIITAIRNSENEITGYIGVAVNISERKKSEQELLEVTNLLKDIFNHYPDGTISVIDRNFRYVFVGGEALKLLGLKRENMIGKRLFPLLTEVQWNTVKQVLQKVFRGEKVTDMDMPDFSATLKFTYDAFPLQDENGVIDKIVIMTRNVSELKKTQEELQVALQKEKELGELKSRFVSMASHEFRTPLSTVLSSAYLIEKYSGTEDQPKRSRHLQRIISSVSMLTDILNDFLSVGKIEEGKIQVRLSEFNIREFMSDTIGEVKNNLKKGQEIQYRHEDESEMVLLDRSLLKHIVLNLISNASKFSPEFSTIEFNTACRRNSVELAIKDHGIGISKADQEHLMERFFRGSNAANIQGTGLGLHIISKYAELMNGSVICNSELDKGTEFTISFNRDKII